MINVAVLQKFVGRAFSDSIVGEIALMPSVKKVRVHRTYTGELIDPLTLEGMPGRVTIHVKDGIIGAIDVEKPWSQQ